jgi:acetamidase/formamidase
MATHHFQPTHYYTAMGTYPSVLHIADGDTVITTTVDGAGIDARNEPITSRKYPNPLTGPFYVEGAEPGDTLALQLDRLVPNRTYGHSSGRVASHVVDPNDVLELPRSANGNGLHRVHTEWYVDVEAGTATLVKPDTKLGRFTLPLSPMLGCLGVAPPREQAISTSTSAEHGGNMDYRGFTIGTTAYFPIFVSGALVFIGDGHALQGDGEIAGTGIEISLDVQFSVRVIKGQAIAWPRGEDEDYIFTVGNARPLEQAVQNATSEMLRWLQADFDLDALAANILIGQCVEYDLGNVVDPAFTMVCKLPKDVLPSKR